MTAVRRMATAAILVALTAVSAPPAFAAAPAEAPAATDAPFLTTIHQANLAEIAAGEDAGKNARAACVKSVGARIVRDHRKLDAGVIALAGKLGVTLPAGLSEAQQEDLAAIQAKAGTHAYDTSWLADQATSHIAALALIDTEVKTGGNAEVRAAAAAARPVVATHLTLIRACEAEIDPS
ncbi:DUF4142 domain-containing protein [Streptomyces odonnellii]|uniref:DUF4142 domain-containing protein n=1 Tax=Streptomyces odonnellii TaxID=1417980 RepID=UPI000A48C819|nr:DUF4142 domain-containing protein [Streptomyces odonnellii]